MRAVAVVFLGLLAIPYAVDSQEPGLVLRSTTRLVQVNVIAQKGSKPVTNLKKEDFTVTDNGKPQKIAFFSENNSGPLLPSVPVALPPNTFTNRLEQKAGTPASITVLLIDTLNTKRNDRIWAQNQVVKFLQQIQPDDHIGIYALGRSLQVLHDYTTDSRDLLQRLAAYKSGAPLPNLSGSETPGAMEGEALMLDSWLNGRGSSGAERDFYTSNRIVGTLKALEFIADHLSRVPGRKNVVWVSGGFPLSIGFDSMAAWHDPSREQRTFGDETDHAVRALNNAGVAIYPVDARGLMTDSSFNAENRGTASSRGGSGKNAGKNSRSVSMPKAPVGSKNQESMFELASRTGGRAYVNTNDIQRAIRDAVNDARVTYTIGFYPENDQFDGKFHTLKVKAAKGGMSLRYRKGYFDMPIQPLDDKLKRAELHDAVYSPLDATEVPLTVRVQAMAKQPNSLEVFVKVEPEAIGLQQADGRWTGKLDVLLVQKDPQGHQYNGKNDTIEMKLLPANYQKVAKDGLIYREVVERHSQATQLRIVVRDAASGSIGSVTVPLAALKN